MRRQFHRKYAQRKIGNSDGRFQHPDTHQPALQSHHQVRAGNPEGVTGAHGTNLAKDKRYDQILRYAIYPG
jgi:hypothetical protein